ncbi:MAG: nucleotidyltransferase family protein [Candidatus Omnitrophica bacterium]|nr:nucleotidyltransferase family protein [Candidatus Omnitrophota bacterium]
MDIQQLIITKKITVREALRRMDEGGEKILFVVDKHDALCGVLTDGDIRRYLLGQGNLHGTIEKVYNAKPRSVLKGTDQDIIKELMVREKIEALPVVDEFKKIVNVFFWMDLVSESTFPRNKIDVPVVIMAGGKGQRLGPFTRILPKALIPVNDKPIIEVIIDRFTAIGAPEFFLTMNYKGEMIKVYFDYIDHKYKIHYLWEKEFLGTAGSLKMLPADIAENFIVSNCDVIVNADYADLLSFHRKYQNLLTVVGTIQHHKIPYGVIHFKEHGKIQNIEEKPEIDFTVNTGVYILSKKALKYIPKGKPFDMPDLIAVLLKKGENISVYPVSEKSYMDVGQWEEYHKTIDRLEYKL